MTTPRIPTATHLAAAVGALIGPVFDSLDALADEVLGCRADAEVDVRLAEMDRQQLGVAVGEVQEMHVAEARQVVEFLSALGGEQGARV